MPPHVDTIDAIDSNSLKVFRRFLDSVAFALNSCAFTMQSMDHTIWWW